MISFSLTPPTVEIGLERTLYFGSESAQITEQICAVLYVDTDLFDGGLAGVVNAIRIDYSQNNNNIVVDAQIQSLLSSEPNAASSIYAVVHFVCL